MTILTMTLISVLLAALGMGAAIGMTHWLERKSWRESLPDSISAMVYLLPATGGWRWLWSLWMILVDVFTFTPAIEILDRSGLGFAAFLPMVMTAFVAVWPLFDTDHRKWHYIFAVLAGIISQVPCVCLVCPWWLLLWISLPLIAYFGRREEWLDGKGVLISEAICYTAVIASCLTE